MAVHRPTFSESWYRVAELRPRLRSGVGVHRQHYRGEPWHILEDPATGRYSRLNDNAYRFVGLLDGRTTVARAWETVGEALGDDAPTQPEVVSLLGQLAGAGLLHTEQAGDAEALFRAHRKRVGREWRGRAASFLFARFPLWDPDRFLSRWEPVFGWLFSRWGLVVWLIVMGGGLVSLAGRWDELGASAAGALAPENWALLYLAFGATKLLHELGHGMACKRLARREGAAGEVHTLGLMLLVLAPVPYVDASSAWTLKSKWGRIAIAAAGMYVELAVAAVAAIVWARTGAGTPVNALAYNVMFIAGVSTALFNANPLLRYDGYYILSDLLELPNLQQRSVQQVQHVVKRLVWGVERSLSPARTAGEAWLLGVYGIASVAYRLVLTAMIVWLLAGRFFVIGMALAVAAAVLFFVMPAGKLVKYLATSPDLSRVRGRAVWTTAIAIGAVGVVIGVVPAPDRVRVQGVVEPERAVAVYAAVDGFVERVVDCERVVRAGEDVVMEAASADLEAELASRQAERDEIEARWRWAIVEDPVTAAIERERLAAAEERVADARERTRVLRITAPIDGLWVPDDAERLRGAFASRGMRIGTVISPDAMIVRAVAPQGVAALIGDGSHAVEMRARSRPGTVIGGVSEPIRERARRDLPSAALGAGAGGGVLTDATDERGLRAAETFFEVRITPDDAAGLRPGQRVVVRFELESRPLVQQAARWVGRLVQKRFGPQA